MFSSKLFVNLRSHSLSTSKRIIQNNQLKRENHTVRRAKSESLLPKAGIVKSRNQQDTNKCKKPEESGGKTKKCNATPFSLKRGGQSTKNGDELTMKALVLKRKEKEVFLCKVPIPNVLKKDEVSIKVKYSVASLVDLNVLEGKYINENPEQESEEVVPGRELSGVVCGTGDGVSHVRAGDCVVVSPCQPSTLCRFCQEENYDVCVKEGGIKTFGVDRDGGWAEFAVAPANLVYKMNDMSLKEAALTPALAQAMCALSKMKITPDQEILLLGCGLSGILIVQLLHHHGHKKVRIWEDNPHRMELIKQLGTNYPIVTDDDLACVPVNVVIAAGAGATVMQQSLQALSPHGSFYVFGAPGKNGVEPTLSMPTHDMSNQSIKIEGITATPVNPAKVEPEIAKKMLQLDKLGVKMQPLQQFGEGLGQLSTGDVNGILFEVGQQ